MSGPTDEEIEAFVRPKFLTILSPLPSTDHVGKRRRGRAPDTPRTYRMSDEQYATVEHAAALLRITTAEFIRWVLYVTANETIAQQQLQVKKK